MYCAYCGKQNADEMLFCGYCGKPLATPDAADRQSDDASKAMYGRPESGKHAAQRRSGPKRIEGAPRFRRATTLVPQRGQDAQEDRPNSIVPISRKGHGRAQEMQGRAVPEPEDLFDVDDYDATPQQEQAQPLELNRTEAVHAESARAAKTIVPRREAEFDEDNLFMEKREDDYDAPEKQRRVEKARAYAYEEAEVGGFFARHIRGFITLAVLLMVGAIIAMWAWSPAGQRVLAQLNLSRQPSAYAQLAEEVARAGSKEMEGYYYARALELDPSNGDYAVRAANAYVAAGNTSRSTELLTRVIELQPDNAEAYAVLCKLYPVFETRPAEVRALIRQGFERTGDPRLAQ